MHRVTANYMIDGLTRVLESMYVGITPRVLYRNLGEEHCVH